MKPFLANIKKYEKTDLIPLWVAITAGIASFNNGGYFFTAASLCQVLLLVGVLIFLLSEPHLIIRNWQPETLVSLLMIGTLAAWTGLTFFWSIAQGETLVEFMRVSSYSAVFLLGCLTGKSFVRQAKAIVPFLLLQGSVMIYALAAKGLPAIFEPLYISNRIYQPIGYTNALACFAAMGLMLALGVSSDRMQPLLFRAGSIVIAYLSCLIVMISLSRGALVAAVVAGAVFLGLARNRITVILASVAAISPAVAVMVWVRAQPALMEGGMSLELRSSAGADLALRALAGLLLCLLLFFITSKLQDWRIVPESVSRGVALVSLAAIVSILLFISGFYIVKADSFSEWVSSKVDEFTSVKLPPAGPERLANINSGMRWQLWGEAYNEWKEHPLTGTGGQTFELVHLKRRETDLFVKQPHGLPARLLVETGLPGLLLMMVFASVVLFKAVRNVLVHRSYAPTLMSGILGLVVVYAVQTSFDWNWNIPALTVVAFFFAGYLVSKRPVL